MKVPQSEFYCLFSLVEQLKNQLVVANQINVRVNSVRVCVALFV